MATIKRYLPTGETRAIWDDSQARRERRQGGRPARASRIEAIPDGPRAGLFHVDFTPLAELTGEPAHRCCLPQTFDAHGDAVRAEVAWLVENYVLAGAGASEH